MEQRRALGAVAGHAAQGQVMMDGVQIALRVVQPLHLLRKIRIQRAVRAMRAREVAQFLEQLARGMGDLGQGPGGQLCYHFVRQHKAQRFGLRLHGCQVDGADGLAAGVVRGGGLVQQQAAAPPQIDRIHIADANENACRWQARCGERGP
ncbi:hypothetical protein D3C87_1663420 [compost metagenome]